MPKQPIRAGAVCDEHEFLMPYEILPLSITDSAESLRVSYMLPTVPFVLPWVILPIVGMCAMIYYNGPMFGSWPLSIGFVGFGIIAGIACLLMMHGFVVIPLRHKRVRFVFDKKTKVLAIPPDETAVSWANIHTVIVLNGWMHDQGERALVSELSVVYCEDGKMYRSALILINKRRARKIAARLVALTGSRFVEIDKEKREACRPPL